MGEDDSACNAYAGTVGIISVGRPARLADESGMLHVMGETAKMMSVKRQVYWASDPVPVIAIDVGKSMETAGEMISPAREYECLEGLQRSLLYQLVSRENVKCTTEFTFVCTFPAFPIAHGRSTLP